MSYHRLFHTPNNKHQIHLKYTASPRLDISVNPPMVIMPGIKGKTFCAWPNIMHFNRRPHERQSSEKELDQTFSCNGNKPRKFVSDKIHVNAQPQWRRRRLPGSRRFPARLTMMSSDRDNLSVPGYYLVP